MFNERFGNILLRQGLITKQKLDFCLNVQKNNGGERIGKVLKHYDFINDEQVAHALALQVGWDVYSGDYEIDQDMVDLLGIEFILKHMVIPVRLEHDVVFVLTRTDDMAATDHIQSRVGTKARFLTAPEFRLRQALDRLALREKGSQIKAGVGRSENNLMFWLNEHLNTAIAKGATDIHIEPSQKAVEIRYRIDGILHFVDSLRLNHLSRLVNIIFHKADVTISDFGHFHDARFTHLYLDRSVDIRVSHIPAIHGSSLVLRLLDKTKTSTALSSLGYGQGQWELIKAGLIKPEGITLIVGPTGCGKTTTLYAMLNHLKSISRKVLTIEDPVEVHLPLMTQVQTNEKRDITFGNAVRAFLRHDPNIVLIGEIRDQETAQEAIRAAMTGHKVFATLHANRPIDAILRLNDLGVPYTHMSGNLTMIVAQRLLRRLCPICKKRSQVFKSELSVAQAKYLKEDGQQLYTANGCDQCSAGYRGRTVVAEVLSIDEAIEIMVGKGDSVGLRQLLSQDMQYKTMFDDARRIIESGICGIEEAVRVLG